MPTPVNIPYPHDVVPHRYREALGAFLVGAPLALLSGWMAFASLPTTDASILTAGLVGATMALAWRRTHPLASFLLVFGACALQAWVSGLFLILPSTLGFLIALYSVMAWGTPRKRLVALGLGLAGAPLATRRLVTDDSVVAAGLSPDWVLVLALLWAVTAAVALGGMWLRAQLAQAEMLTDRAHSAEQDRHGQTRSAVLQERQRIAREMHDIVAHSLSVIISQARGGRFVAESRPERAVEILSTIENEGRQALRDMRGLVSVLRWEAEQDPPEAPQPGLAQLPQLLDRTRELGREVGFEVTGTAGTLGASGELAIYRLTQEALTNVVRHAAVDARVEVRLIWKSTAMVIEVVNDHSAEQVSETGGFGLLGMRERIGAVGGTMSVDPDQDGRFAVTAEVPYPSAIEAVE